MAGERPIFIHTFSGPFGGSERILLDLLDRIDRQIVLACPSGVLADAAEAAGVAVIRLKVRSLETRGLRGLLAGVAHLVQYALDVRAVQRDVKPVVTIAWNMRAALAQALISHSASSPIVAQHVDLLPRGIRGRLAGWAIRKADLVIALSGAIADDLSPNWQSDGNVIVVNPGVPLPAECPVDDASRQTVLVLAALEPWKGQDVALEAAARVPNIKLVLAGDPVGRSGERFLEQLKERASAADLRGRVEFPGVVDPTSALASSGVLLHPARREPFGRAIVEAMAAGRPVVAVNDGGPREIVDETCGILVEPSDHRAMGEAISQLTTDSSQAERLGNTGRRLAGERFDPVTQAVLWERSVMSVVDAQGPGTGVSSRQGESLSLVTVIHESAADLARLLESIERHLPAAEVIVVDSGSTDGGAGLAGGWSGNAKVVELDGNEGYGSGCVRGMVEATRQVTCLINPDVELVDDSLHTLALSLSSDAHPDRLLAPILIHPDGKRQDSAHPPPGGLGDLARALVPASVMPSRLARFAEPHRTNEPIRVAWAVGACLLGRTSTLRELGPFDPAVHLYAEDLDLCLRAADRGIETWLDPGARVIHREAHSSMPAFGGEPFDLLAQRRREVIRQRRGSSVLVRDDLIQGLTNCTRIALKSLLGRDTHSERSRLRALRKARGAR